MDDNKKRTKTKRRGNKAWVKGGASPNPKGAPKRGQSWKEIYSTIGNLTPKEAAEYCRAVAGKIGSIGDQVTLKEAVVLRVYAALLFEPDARLLNTVMDRDEGKVSQTVEVLDWRKEAERHGYDSDQLFRDMVNAARRRLVEQSSGGSLDGSAEAD